MTNPGQTLNLGLVVCPRVGLASLQLRSVEASMAS